ncbi:amino acid permease [Oecophyllibacter saccharovorans]|uniref:APC family permease n=1 Tax=Oecophyllibacter saccharovorans TaxID=2558360 RepID=UPI0011431B37|nr:amino acid permease [Oecophyllibacter saccharovorans]QDH15803.1 amino acid permease [Oecophyllibacter saccharovorans]
MLHSLWRTKPITSETEEDESSGLKRVFGPWQLIALGVGVTIGAGLFSLTGIAAGQYAGPAVTLSFLIAALACSFAGLCYAELAGMIPASGSAYSYAYASMGEFAAWTIGWDLILEFTVNASAVASSWAGYLNSLLNGWGLSIDPRLLSSPLLLVRTADGHMVHGWLNAPSVFIVFAVMFMLMSGTSGSSKVNTLIVLLKLAIIIGVIALCVPVLKASNYHPFIPANTGRFGQFGASGLLRAAALIFFSYIGFEIVSTVAKDTRDPQKNIPIGILGTLFVCAVIYAVFSFILVGVVNYRALANDPNPVATAMDAIHMPWMAQVMKLGITIGYIAGIYGLMLGQSRVAMAMSEDGLLPAIFAKVNPRTQTPNFSYFVTASLTAVLTAFLPLEMLGNMTSIGTLLAFIIVCIGVMALRLKAPELPRRFWVPGGTFLVPCLGILSCGIVMFSMDGRTWLQLVLWLLVGVIVYFAYARPHSHLHLASLAEETARKLK